MVMLRIIKNFLLLLMLCSSAVHAQTILGGNLTWESLAGDQYNITLNLYVDCYGLATSTSPYPQTVDIAFNADASCTGAAFTAFSASANNTSFVENIRFVSGRASEQLLQQPIKCQPRNKEVDLRNNCNTRSGLHLDSILHWHGLELLL